MKVRILGRIVLKEFIRNLVISIAFFILLDYIYVYFAGIDLKSSTGLILWQGGDERTIPTISSVLLKLLNISVIFLAIGKNVEKLKKDVTLNILSRFGSYKGFVFLYFLAVLLQGVFLLVISHITYFCFTGIESLSVKSCIDYFTLDCLGLIGVIVVFIIFDNVLMIDNSFLYVIFVYVLNTVVPKPILIVFSTAKYIELRERIGWWGIFSIIMIIDAILITFFCCLISKRRVNVC